MRTIVYQSYRPRDVDDWIVSALNSVRVWAENSNFDYRIYGDEIFDRVPEWYQQKAVKHVQVSMDLGRLVLARELLDAGYERVIWLDADVLVFDPLRFSIQISEGCAFAREVWVQRSADGQLKTYKNVHNAFACFCQESTFLDFYIETCKSIIGRAHVEFPPHIVGSKLLTALHNIVDFQLVHSVAMASPLIVNDLNLGSSAAIDLLSEMTSGPICAASLCASLVGGRTDGVDLKTPLITTAIDLLMRTKGARLNL